MDCKHEVYEKYKVCGSQGQKRTKKEDELAKRILDKLSNMFGIKDKNSPPPEKIFMTEEKIQSGLNDLLKYTEFDIIQSQQRCHKIYKQMLCKFYTLQQPHIKEVHYKYPFITSKFFPSPAENNRKDNPQKGVDIYNFEQEIDLIEAVAEDALYWENMYDYGIEIKRHLEILLKNTYTLQQSLLEFKHANGLEISICTVFHNICPLYFNKIADEGLRSFISSMNKIILSNLNNEELIVDEKICKILGELLIEGNLKKKSIEQVQSLASQYYKNYDDLKGNIRSEKDHKKEDLLPQYEDNISDALKNIPVEMLYGEGEIAFVDFLLMIMSSPLLESIVHLIVDIYQKGMNNMRYLMSFNMFQYSSTIFQVVIDQPSSIFKLYQSQTGCITYKGINNPYQSDRVQLCSLDYSNLPLDFVYSTNEPIDIKGLKIRLIGIHKTFFLKDLSDFDKIIESSRNINSYLEKIGYKAKQSMITLDKTEKPSTQGYLLVDVGDADFAKINIRLVHLESDEEKPEKIPGGSLVQGYIQIEDLEDFENLELLFIRSKKLFMNNMDYDSAIYEERNYRILRDIDTITKKFRDDLRFSQGNSTVEHDLMKKICGLTIVGQYGQFEQEKYNEFADILNGEDFDNNECNDDVLDYQLEDLMDGIVNDNNETTVEIENLSMSNSFCLSPLVFKSNNTNDEYKNEDYQNNGELEIPEKKTNIDVQNNLLKTLLLENINKNELFNIMQNDLEILEKDDNLEAERQRQQQEQQQKSSGKTVKPPKDQYVTIYVLSLTECFKRLFGFIMDRSFTHFVDLFNLISKLINQIFIPYKIYQIIMEFYYYFNYDDIDRPEIPFTRYNDFNSKLFASAYPTLSELMPYDVILLFITLTVLINNNFMPLGSTGHNGILNENDKKIRESFCKISKKQKQKRQYIYRGFLVNDKRNGEGKMVFLNGDSYRGNWADGHMSGKGTYSWKDGSYYIGNFVNSRFEGEGELHFADESYYKGNFHNGKFVGEGSYIWADRTACKAQWGDDKRNGIGGMTFPNGDMYVGIFKDDLYHGEGEIRFNNGDMFYGEFRFGQMDGQGMYQYKNGDEYKGWWKGDKKYGEGIYTTAKGNKYKEFWTNDTRKWRKKLL